ncbi:MAG: rod shape-determining protein RodA [Candidatus Paceibacterota bacterium]
MISSFFKRIDWLLLVFLFPILFAGLFTMKSFTVDAEGPDFFLRQSIWIVVSLSTFFILASMDLRVLKRTGVLVTLFLFFLGILAALFVLGKVSNGAQSWFDLGGFSFQPADMMKLVLVLVLAKYFSRRHVEIKNIKHIFISGLYAVIPFLLVFLQPDFGSAMVIFFIWFGMVLVSGISKKHLILVGLIGVISFLGLWFFVFADYQKDRIVNFLNPMADIHGSGYNVFQSTIAIGSGQVVGKGLGFGTQSRLKFLPEPETDFIFAAFSEEWGFIGSFVVLMLFFLLIWRILHLSALGASNFETLFGLGLAIFFMTHIIINVGMNLGIFPVTGIPLPFMSYGGSHLITEFAGLGILVSLSRYARSAHRDAMRNEFLGLE